MLKLKKLQILGFKSFCDRTELRFQGDGIAAIVGPNGCGKSNISDSISWALGEQSAVAARVNMQDVIFAGTLIRKATGMAEVSLTLVDPRSMAMSASRDRDRGNLPEEWDGLQCAQPVPEEVDRYTEEVRPGLEDQKKQGPTRRATLLRLRHPRRNRRLRRMWR